MSTTDSSSESSTEQYEHIVLVVANSPTPFDEARQERAAQVLGEACEEEGVELAATEFGDGRVHVYIESGHDHGPGDVVEALKATSARRYRYNPNFRDSHLRWSRGMHDGTVGGGELP